ncbi:MAG: SDR family oxidoreductase [Cyanobacteria bacterium J06554_3]
MSLIFLAGASRGVGREIAKRLVVGGYDVVALLRNNRATEQLMAMGITVVSGDAMDADMMTRIMGDFPVDCVISTIGGTPDDGGPRADFTGNKNLIDAAVVTQAKRFVMISSIGSGNSAQALPPNVLETLGPVLKEKAQAEEHLAKSGLDYTVIRPGGLVSESATGKEILTEDMTVAGSIPRAGVAALAVKCLDTDRTVNKVFSAIDLSMQRTDKEIDIFEFESAQEQADGLSAGEE